MPCLTDPAPFAAEFFCARCRAPFLNRAPLDDAGLCGVCRRGAPAFDAAYAYGFYDGTLAKLVRTYKYGRVQTLARPLGGLLSAALPRDEEFDVIAPMPLHWRKRWQRGFNQSELLARELARRTGIPVRRAVKRVRFTNAQAGLTGHQRRDNVSGAFRGIEGIARGKRVLLIDDVLTTGATAAACARALKMSGAARVTILTLARADRRLDVMLFPRTATASVGEF